MEIHCNRTESKLKTNATDDTISTSEENRDDLQTSIWFLSFLQVEHDSNLRQTFCQGTHLFINFISLLFNREQQISKDEITKRIAMFTVEIHCIDQELHLLSRVSIPSVVVIVFVILRVLQSMDFTARILCLLPVS